jgi:hypothetical protein
MHGRPRVVNGRSPSATSAILTDSRTLAHRAVERTRAEHLNSRGRQTGAPMAPRLYDGRGRARGVGQIRKIRLHPPRKLTSPHLCTNLIRDQVPGYGQSRPTVPQHSGATRITIHRGGDHTAIFKSNCCYDQIKSFSDCFTTLIKD